MSEWTGAARRFSLQPERRLLLAVLEDAIRTYQRFAFTSDRRGVTLLSEVEAWFASADSDRTFAFVAICNALGLEISYLRRGLARLREREWIARQAGKPFPRCGAYRMSGTRHRTVLRTDNRALCAKRGRRCASF